MVKFLIQRPIAVTVTLIAFIVMSLAATGLIPVSLMPEIDIPEILVKMDVPDKPVRDMEEQLVSRVRRQLLQTTHLDDIESSASNGHAYIRLRFSYGTNINYAFIEVNEKIDALMHMLPKETARPRVIKTSPTDIPVFYLNVSLKDSLEEKRFMELSQFCEQVIKKRVEQLPEVAMADISGTESPEIVIQADIEKLRLLGIDRSTFIKALESNNYSVGNIKVRSGLYEFNVRYASLLKDRNDIENLYIHVGQRIFRLKDLATINIRPAQDHGMYLSGTKRSVVMGVIKKSNARIASLKENTNNLIKILNEDYPNLRFGVERNQTELLDYSLGNLKFGLLVGGVLAFLIMFLFLKDLKSPFLIGISVPVSLIISLLFFFLFDISINIISLSGLILGVGMMIDNSIIVIDNIVQYREKGDTVFKACIRGTNEVIRPLISSVLTTCAVFVPLVFLSGISGALFYDQAMAVAIGLGVSLLVSFTLIPVYFRLFYKEKNQPELKMKQNLLDKIRLYNYIENSYSKSFNFVFRNHALIFSCAALFIIAGYFVFTSIRREKFPSLKQTEAIISVDWNRNITVGENQKRVSSFLSSCDSLLVSSSVMVGPQDFLLDATNRQGASETQLYIKCKDENTLKQLIKQFESFCKTKYPEAILSSNPPPNLFEKVFSSNSSPLEIRLFGKGNSEPPSPEAVSQITSKVSAGTGISMNNKLRLQNFFRIVPNYEKLLLYRVSVNELISVLRKAFNQLQVFTLKQGQTEVPVFLSGQEKSIDQIIQSTRAWSENKEYIPLSSLVGVQEGIDYKVLQGGKSDIFIAISYNVSQKEADSIVAAYKNTLKEHPLIEMEVRGSLIENTFLFREMIIILLVALLLLYFILAAQFESLVQPLIVLIELPIDIGGALVLLWLTGNSLNLMAFIGIIVMTGIIINDSILKIDTINRMLKSKIPIMEAIHFGGTRRLKPIIMTSATTILAMVPFLFGDDMGSRLQQPLAITVIGGMTLGTLVSLYFVPLCYYYLVRKRREIF